MANNFLNIDEIDLTIKKLFMYQREEDLAMEKIDSLLNDFLSFYRGLSQEKIKEINNNITRNFDQVKTNQQLDLEVLQKKKLAYQSTYRKTIEILGDILD